MTVKSRRLLLSRLAVLVILVVVVAAVRRLGDVRRLDRRTWLLLTAASALIAANWVIYVYAVNNGHVVDAALGYFINPLVSIAPGLVVFPKTSVVSECCYKTCRSCYFGLKPTRTERQNPFLKIALKSVEKMYIIYMEKHLKK